MLLISLTDPNTKLSSGANPTDPEPDPFKYVFSGREFVDWLQTKYGSIFNYKSGPESEAVTPEVALGGGSQRYSKVLLTASTSNLQPKTQNWSRADVTSFAQFLVLERALVPIPTQRCSLYYYRKFTYLPSFPFF